MCPFQRINCLRINYLTTQQTLVEKSVLQALKLSPSFLLFLYCSLWPFFWHYKFSVTPKPNWFRQKKTLHELQIMFVIFKGPLLVTDRRTSTLDDDDDDDDDAHNKPLWFDSQSHTAAAHGKDYGKRTTLSSKQHFFLIETFLEIMAIWNGFSSSIIKLNGLQTDSIQSDSSQIKPN